MNNYITPPPPGGNRIEWIDCLRGFTMILVVYHHILWFPFNELSTNINSIFLLFRMPMFFFVAGFVGYKSVVNSKWLKEKTLNRLLKQFFPTIVIGLTYIFFTSRSVNAFVFSIMREGYWFTITMFEIFLIFALLDFFIDKISISSTKKTIIFLTISIFCFSYWIYLSRYRPDLIYYSKTIFGAVGVVQIVHYLPWFLFGVIAKMYNNLFFNILTNKVTITTIFILFILEYAVIPQFINISFLQKPLGSLLMIFIIFRIFYFFQTTFSSETLLGRTMIYIGKNTLPIYLIHYFFLQGIDYFGPTPLKDLIANSWLSELIIVSFLAIIITFACLAVEKLLQAFPIIHRLLLGFDIK